MTECALPQPVMLSTTTNVFNRRSSIRRGTISSISKDIRVNDFVEIIKKQKKIQQQERQAAAALILQQQQENTLLKRRHSMLSMLNNTNITRRNRTMSNADLNHTFNVSQQQKQYNKTPAQQRYDATDRIRLEASQDQHQQQQTTTLYQQHLRKCSACFINKQNEEDEEDDSSSTCSSLEEQPREQIMTCSPSTSTSSTNSSSSYKHHRPFLNPKNTCSSTMSLIWQPPTNTKQDNAILNDLNSTMNIMSQQMKELTFNNKIDKYKIQECKALVAQQQRLLAQLEESIVDDNKALEPLPQRKKDLFNNLYKSWTLPKSRIQQFIIKQKADKNELDTIITVQGVCTTIESSLIPDRLLLLNNDMTTFNQVYQYHYKIDITHKERMTIFKLLNEKDWQPDHQAHICSFKQCKQEFNWFQRKHHCRGCGQVFCHIHSNNKLPLFDSKKPILPTFSRVCDTCFFTKVGDALL